MTLQNILGDFEFFRFEDDVIREFVPKLQFHLLNKNYITLQSFFNDFHDYFAEDIDYEAIVALFEEMWTTQTVRNKRKKYLLSHWLYYQAIRVIPDLSQEERFIAQIQQMIDKKNQCGKIIDNIVKKIQFKADQKDKFQSNIKNSRIYNQCSKFLHPSNLNELSHEKIQQRHEELIYITRKMGSLGESSIQYELQKHILVSFQNAYKKISNQGAHASNKLMEIKALLQLMQRQNHINDKIRGKIQEFKLANDQKSKYNSLEGIKSQLTVLDVFLLEYLISLSRKNTQQKDKNQLKNIILLVGPSGSGKTTIILRLLGYRLVQTEIQQLLTLQPQNLRSQHSPLQTSSQSPTTRYMFSTKIPKNSFKIGLDEDLYICDTPGFEDSAGCEVDISNSIIFQTFLKNCASVKLAIVISQRKVGDRMDGIRQIAKIVSRLVVQYSEIEGNVSIILNQFDSQAEYERIRPGIESVLQNLSAAEKSNKEYVAFLSSLGRRFKNKKHVDLIRFDPQKTEIEEVIQQMKQGRIFKHRDVFKYSLSTKSNQCITNRKTTLVRFIRQYIGKNNYLAFYYLNELIILNSSLNNQPEIHLEIQNIKQLIKDQVYSKFKTFEKRIDAYILQNDVNSNTFKDLNQIKEQVKTFEIFNKFVDQLTTVQKLQSKVTEVKTKILENLNKLSFYEGAIQQSKYKIFNTIKFFSKFQPQLQKSVLDKIIEAFSLKKNELLEILCNKRFQKIKSKTNQLKVIFEIIQTSRQSIKIEENQPFPQKIPLIKKEQLTLIKSEIMKQFQLLVSQSIDFISSKDNFPYLSERQSICKISNNIDILEKLQGEEPILDQIYPSLYKNQIISTYNTFLRKFLEQSTKLFNLSNSSEPEDRQLQKIICSMNFIQKQKYLKGISKTIQQQITKLQNKIIQELRFFFEISKKSIDKRTLKRVTQIINIVIKLSEGNNNLYIQTNNFKSIIKRIFLKHFEQFNKKIDNLIITLKIKKTIEPQSLDRAINLYEQLEAFYKNKYFNQPRYLKNECYERKNNGEDSEDQKQNSNLKEIVKQNYDCVVSRIFQPFKQINQLSKMMRSKHINKLSLYDISNIIDFFIYKSYLLGNTDIASSKYTQQKMHNFEYNEDGFFFNMRKIIQNIKRQFDQLYGRFIEEDEFQLNLYSFDCSKVSNFTKLSNIILRLKSNYQFEQLSYSQHFNCQQYISKIVQVLSKLQKLIKIQLRRRKNDLDFCETLQNIREIVELIKGYDQVDFKRYKEVQFTFTQIYDQISNQIKKIQEKQFNSLINQFKENKILNFREVYQKIQKDELKNVKKQKIIYNSLKEQGQKLKKTLNLAKKQYENDDTMLLVNQNAKIYIYKLEKAFNFYEEVKQFASPTFLEEFSLNEEYFKMHLTDLSIEQRLQLTYLRAKDKILEFNYKSKPKQFQKIVIAMRRAQYVVEKITKDTVYSQLYLATQSQQVYVIQANKFSARLTYFMTQQFEKIRLREKEQKELRKIVQQLNQQSKKCSH